MIEVLDVYSPDNRAPLLLVLLRSHEPAPPGILTVKDSKVKKIRV